MWIEILSHPIVCHLLREPISASPNLLEKREKLRKFSCKLQMLATLSRSSFMREAERGAMSCSPCTTCAEQAMCRRREQTSQTSRYGALATEAPSSQY